MEVIKTVVELLSDHSITLEAKLRGYSQIRDALESSGAKGQVIKNDDTIRRVFACANFDVASQDSDVQESALLTLNLLFKCKCSSPYLDNVPSVYIEIAWGEGTERKKNVCEAASNCIQSCLQELISHNRWDLENQLMKLDTDVARKKILELIPKACTNVPVQRSIIFFYESLIPQMLDTPSASVREDIFKQAMELLPQYSVTLLNTQKLEAFKTKIKTRYVERLTELQNVNDLNWHNLWIFLVRCCGRILHVQLDIMNSLLKIVEAAFRNSPTEGRVLAYDCWKELINNYSLDMDRMCNSKQMKLIITPLTTNISRVDIVTCKRFELWIHLINVLQERAVLCLEPYLVFCFGPIGESPYIAVDNPEIRSPGRKVPNMWRETTQALLDIIGHYGHDVDNVCVEYTNGNVLKLNCPLINSSTFANFDYQIINSVGECSALMLLWMGKYSIEKVLKCMWGSLFNIIKQLEGRPQLVAIERIILQLKVYIDSSKDKPEYFSHILLPVLELLLEKQFFEVKVYTKYFLFPLILCLLKHNDAKFIRERKIMLDLVGYGFKNVDKNGWFKQAYNVLVKVEVRKSINNLILFWIECADMLAQLCTSPEQHTREIIQTIGIEFMVWPIQQINKITNRNIHNEFIENWGFAFQQLYKAFPKESIVIFQNLQNNIQISSTLASNAVQLFHSFQPLLSASCDEQFVSALVNVTSDLLMLPELSRKDASFLVPILETLLNIILAVTNDESSKKATFEMLCQCCKQLLQPHEQFKILNPLEKLFENIPNFLKVAVPESLCNLINNLTKHNDLEVAQLAKKIKLPKKELMVKSEKTFITPSKQLSRTAKIMARTKHLKMDTPVKEAKNSKEEPRDFKETSTFHIFGKTTDWPLIRGSQLGSDKPKLQKQKVTNTFANLNKTSVIDDGDEASYVLIDGQYEFNKDKLSDHQLEVFKKRRSDIPALYNDLSQSQSCSQNSLQIESKSENIGNINKKPTVESQQDMFCSEDQSSDNTRELFSQTSDQVSRDSFIMSVNTSAEGTQRNLVNSEPETSSHIKQAPSEISDEQNCNHIQNQNSSAESGLCQLMDKIEKGTELSEVCESSISSENKSRECKNAVSFEVIKLLDHKGCQSNNSKIQNAKLVEEESPAKIVHKIGGRERSKSKETEGRKSVLHSSNNEAKETIKPDIDNTIKEKILGLGVEKEQNNFAEDEIKRLSRVQKELNKIKMDIVGGDMFVQNLDLESKIKTRRSDTSSLLKGSKILTSSRVNYDSDDGKTDGDSNRRLRSMATDKLKEKQLSPKTNKLGSPSSGKSKTSNGDIQSPARRKLVMNKISDSVVDKDSTSINANSIQKSSVKKRSLVFEDSSTSDCSPSRKRRKGLNLGNTKAKEHKTEDDTVKPEEVSIECNKIDGSSTKDNVESQNSEDIIESSQESLVDNITESVNIKTRLDSRGDVDEFYLLNSKIQQIMTKISETHKQKPNCHNDDVQVNENDSSTDMLNNSTAGLLTSKKSEDTKNNHLSENISTIIPSTSNSSKDTESCHLSENIVGACSPDALMEIDLTSKISVNAQQDTCEMDTETQEEIVTPKKSVNIPSSPVNVDTPTRTNELISSTLNISPIKSALKSREETSCDIKSALKNKENTQKTEDLFESEICRIEDSVASNNNQPSVNNAQKDNAVLNGAEENIPEDDNRNMYDGDDYCSTKLEEAPRSNGSSSLSEISSRSEKLLNLVPGTITPKSIKKFHVKIRHKVRHNTLSSHNNRIQKMMQNCGNEFELEKTQNSEIIQIQDSDEESKNVMSENDFLQFTRELPGPAASPKFSILKRRRTSDITDEGLSPPRKQKRVNFSDPPMTCQKLFFRDEYDRNETQSIHSVESLPRELQMDLPKFEIQHLNFNETDIVNNIEDDGCDSEAVVVLQTASSDVNTDSMGLQTQGSVDITDAYLLNREQPMFSELIESKESIHNILDLITSPICTSALLEELQRKNLYTVGDLAKLSEVEVYRLPFKPPQVENVRSALIKFHNDQKSIVASVNGANIETTSKEILCERDANILNTEEESMMLCREVSDMANKQQQMEIRKLELNDVMAKSEEKSVKVLSSITFSSSKSLQNSETENSMTAPNYKIIRSSVMKPIYPSSAVVDFSESSEPVTVPTLKKVALDQTSTAEEKKNLQKIIIRVIDGFKNLQENALEQGLKESSFYETLVEFAGPEAFISVLSSVKRDKELPRACRIENNNWKQETIRKLWSTRLPEVSPDNLVAEVFKQMPDKDVHMKKSVAVALRHLDIRQIIEVLHSMHQTSDFSIKQFFECACFTFSPSIENFSFQHINVVQLNDNVLERSQSNLKDLGNFIERILTETGRHILPSIFPKDKMLALYDHEELIDRIIVSTSEKKVLSVFAKAIQQMSAESISEHEDLALAYFSKLGFFNISKYMYRYANNERHKEGTYKK